MENTAFHCFVCTKDVDLQTSVDFCQEISLHSLVMIRILDLPVDYTDLSDKIQNILFCSACYLKLQKTRLALEKLEELEEHVLQHKFEIETNLKNIQHAQEFLEGNTEPSLEFRKEISKELKARTIISMMSKLKRKNLVGNCKTHNGSIRVMKNVEIPQRNMNTETLEVSDNDRSRCGENHRKQSVLSAPMTADPLKSHSRINPTFEVPCQNTIDSRKPIDSVASGTNSVGPIQIYVDTAESGFDLTAEDIHAGDRGMDTNLPNGDEELFLEEIQQYKVEVLDYQNNGSHQINVFCETCGLVFENFNELQVHEQLHFPPAQIDIQENDRAYGDDMSGSRAGALTNTNTRPVRPGPSLPRTESKEHARHRKVNIKKRIRQRQHFSHNSNTKCKMCGNQYSKKSNLKRHILSAHGEKKFFCDGCNSGFAVFQDLRRHVQRSTHCSKHPSSAIFVKGLQHPLE